MSRIWARGFLGGVRFLAPSLIIASNTNAGTFRRNALFQQDYDQSTEMLGYKVLLVFMARPTHKAGFTCEFR